MKTKRIIFTVIVSFMLILSFACDKSQEQEQKKKEVELAEKSAMNDIKNMSYSVLGRLSPINISFKKDIKFRENLKKACSLSPEIKGEWKVLSNKNLQFRPSECYDFTKEYTLSLDVGLLLDNEADKRKLTTTFSIAEPEFKIVSGDLIPDKKNDNFFSFEAFAKSDIPLELDTVKKILSAKIKSPKGVSDVKLVVSKAAAVSQYKVKIEKIKRDKFFQELLLSWNLSLLGLDQDDSVSFSIAPEALFQVTKISQLSDNEICVNFSDSIDDAQDLRGFISVKSQEKFNYRWTVDDFKLKIFSQNRSWPEDAKLVIFKGIKSKKGKKLEKNSDFSIRVSWDKPDIIFSKQGNIVVAKDKTSVFVSTKNIKGLILEVFQIYQDNILQHLQVNSLAETSQMRRVGEPVFRQRFDFEWQSSMRNKWQSRELDLTKLLEKYPDGMFELRVSYIKKDSMYKDGAGDDIFSHLPFPRDISEFDLSVSVEEDYWDYANISYNDRYSNNDSYNFWRNRDNPNHPAYYLPSYGKNCLATKLVLVSDIGLSVKKDCDNKLYIAVADLNTAEGIKGANVKLFSYAQKELASARTDSDGLLVMDNDKDAYFVQVENNGRYNWIRLNSNTLSTSHFEVDGVKTKKGVKGYIYGERGVWRPGDDIHLTFILQDLEKSLPKDIPVTFSLEDPMGRKTDTKILNSSVDGFYRFDTKTNEDDKTGNWIARVTVGGKTWAKYLKVENIIPNKLFVDLKPVKKYLSAGNNLIKLSSGWLHGAKASGLEAEISARYILDRTPFEKYKNYNFINPEVNVKSELKKVWEGYLNQEGLADVNLSLSSGKRSPGKLTAIFETRVYEPSGMFSIENKSFSYSPYKQYVGMEIPESDDEYRDMLYTEREQNFNFLVLDADGNPKKGKSDIVVKLYKLSWYWWWNVDEEDTNYTTSRNTRLIKTWDLSAKNGKANLKFKLKDDDWGRYLISVSDKNGGHSSSQVIYFDWEAWARRSSASGKSASMLMITNDKAKYYDDETAVVNFPSYKGAKALITIEKNGKVLKQEWVDCNDELSSYKFKLDKSMAPNVYVHISLIQEHNQTKNSLPIRLYGITPVMVEDRNSRLNPEIQAAKVFEPNEKASFTISEKNGKPMTCTIAVVDEGLLGLTAFNTHNPWNSFYKKESSQLLAWDMYGLVIDAHFGSIASTLSVGGGGYIDRKGGKSAQRFKPVVFYFGPYEVKANEKKKIEFDMPQYSGAVRIMTVAGKNGAYGVAEKEVKVKSDLIVMPTLPRTLGNGEEIEIPVTAFNGTDKERTANLKFTAKGAISFSDAKKVTIPANSDKTVFFKVKTDKPGVAEFNAELSSRGISKTAKSKTEIAVVSRGTPYTDIESFNISAGKSALKKIELKGEPGTRAVAVEVSQMPSLGLEQRLSYLLNYPNGCIEQITSKAFSQLYLPDILNLSEEEISKVKININSVLERYRDYQTQSGAFAYWPNQSTGDDWGTNYAGHFMTEAKKQGYSVNESVYNAWLERQKEQARNWSSGYSYSVENQAYRLYTLANAGCPEIGAMNRLKNIEEDLNNTSRAMLAASYALAGYQKVAKILASKLLIPHQPYRYTGYNFASHISDTALVLNAYTAVNDKTKIGGLIKTLAKISASDKWLSTQETGWILIGLAPYYKFDKLKNISYEVHSGSDTIKEKLTSSSRIHKLNVKNEDSKEIGIRNTGEAPLFVSITSSGRLSPDEVKDMSSNLGLEVSFYSEDGERIDKSQLKKLGKRFKVKVEVQNKTSYPVYNIVLSLPIPTGWEMTNLRMGDSDSNDSSSNSVYDYQDVKDTHIYTYFDLKAKKTKTLEFLGTVVFNGNFFIPAISVEAMYDDEYKAVKVVK